MLRYGWAAGKSQRLISRWRRVRLVGHKGGVQGIKERNMNGVNESELESHMSADGPFVWRQFLPRELNDALRRNVVLFSVFDQQVTNYPVW